MSKPPTPTPPAPPPKPEAATGTHFWGGASITPPAPEQGPATETARDQPSVPIHERPHRPPTFVPGYEILGELGQGGMGVVYKARQIRLNRMVALKMIGAGAHARAHELARFHSEAAAIARLQHPGIVQIYEIGEQDGVPYLALEFCAGGSLAAWLDGTPLPPLRAAEVVEVLARAVQAAHQAGIVHRDLKPDNVLMMTPPEGVAANSLHGAGPLTRLKIGDFGLAKTLNVQGDTQSGDVLGTPSYMAPEQAAGKGKEVGPAADVYSLGAILYELLTGHPPFKAATPMETILQVLSDEPAPPRQLQSKLPADVQTICLKCLQKEPRKRYSSAEALAEDLRRFQEHEPIAARPINPAERAWRWARRHPLNAVLLTALVLVIAAGFIAVSCLLVLAEERRDEAEEASRKATRQSERTAEENLRYRHTLYAAHTQLAHREWWDGHITTVLALLEGEGCRPAQSDQTDLRGWEWYYLRNLCHKDARTLRGDRSHVNNVVFSPDGRTLAVSGIKGVHVWDVVTGRKLHTFPGQEVGSMALAYSPDGRYLAWGRKDASLTISEMPGAKEVCTIHPRQPIRFVAFSPDGRWLASGGWQGAVILWQCGTWKEDASFPGHHSQVDGLAFSPDSQYLVSSGVDRTVRLWDVAGKRLIRMFAGHTDKVNGVAFSPNGRQLASVSEDYSVRLWEVASGKVLHVLHGHNAYVWGVAYSPDGRRLASAGDDYIVRVWDTASGKEVRTFRGHEGWPRGVAFSPDGRWLVSGGQKGSVKFWDMAGESQIARTFRGHSGPITCVAFAPDNQTVATASRDGTLVLWGVARGTVLSTLARHQGEVWGAAFSPDGRLLASSSSDTTVKLWDTRTRGELRTLRGHTKIVRKVAFSPDGLQIASASDDTTVKLWDTGSGRKVRTLTGHTREVNALAFHPDGRQLASVSSDGTVKLWDTAGGREIDTLRGSNKSFCCVAFSPDGKHLAAGDTEGLIRLWDMTQRREPRILRGHTNTVLGLAFGPFGRLASASNDQTVKIWDASLGYEVLTLKGHSSLVYSVGFSPDGRWLASASADKALKLWDGDRNDSPPDLVARAASPVNDPALAPLRLRENFQKLLRSLDIKPPPR